MTDQKSSHNTLAVPGFDAPDQAVGEQGSAATRPPRTRHAATLIVVRRDGDKPRVLMGRRNPRHVFMPGKWVFPGGRVDRGDFTAPAASELPPEVETQLRVEPRHASPARLPRALALAAVRELFEEAGLLLARPAPARPASGGWREFVAHGALPDLAAMRFVARAITPPFRPRRFDARFFMAEASALMSLERLPDCGELDEIAWFDIDQARELDLPNVTRFVIEEVVARQDEPHRPIPFTRARAGQRHLVLI